MTSYYMNGVGDRTVRKMETQYLLLPDKPKMAVDQEPPALPGDVSDLDDKDLMALFAEFTAWTDYAAAQLGLAVINERAAERGLELAEAEAWKDLPSKVSVSAAKALVVLDEKVQRAKRGLDDAYAYRRMVGEAAARYERDAAVLSRELTRRTSEHGPKQKRRDRWAGA